MSSRRWAYLASVVGLLIFGGVVLGYGYVGFWILPPHGLPVSHTAENAPSQYVETYLVVGVIGTALSLGILGRLILTGKKKQALQC